jgi:hypothetical protein
MLSFNDYEKRKAHTKAVTGRTRKSLSFDGDGQFFFLITCHRESMQILLDVYQIRRQSEAEYHGKNGHDIDDGASRFESPGFGLCACAPIAIQTSKRQNNASNDRPHSEPYRQTPGALRMALRLRELPNGDREASNRKPKYDHRQARAHPGKKRALIRQVIASARRIIRLWHFPTTSVPSQGFYVQQRWVKILAGQRELIFEKTFVLVLRPFTQRSTAIDTSACSRP